MSDDDELLHGHDLDAWQAPPPPAGLADAVIARMREPSPVPAIEPSPAPPRAGATGRARALVGGTIALSAAAAAAAIALAPGAGTAPVADGDAGRRPGGERGALATTELSQLELGGSWAELEPGTEVRWRREPERVVIEQSRGIALWQVAREDHFVIDAGATVASVEASGASLRVEVEMSLSSTRILGASAATAALVSLITVVVYEGHVTVASAGTTVTVPPGGTVKVRPGQPPVRRPAPADAPTVGAAPVGRAPGPPVTVPSPVTVPPLQLDGLRIAGNRLIAPDEDTKKEIAKAGRSRLTGSFKLCIDVAGAVSAVTRLKTTGFAAYDAKLAREISKWRYRPYLVAGKPVPVCTAVTFIFQVAAAAP